MTPGLITAQLLAFAGLASNIASVQCRRRRFVLSFQIMANLLYGLQYVFLGAWSGLAVSLVSAVECLIVYYYANKRTDGTGVPLAVSLAVVSITTALGLITYVDGFSWIPIAVTILYTWSVWQPRLRLFRLSAVLISTGWLVYNWHVLAYVSTCTAVVELLCAVTAIIRIDLLGGQSTR